LEEVDWGRIFFALGHYCSLGIEEIKKLTLPQLQIYLEQVKEQIEYEIKLHGMEVDKKYVKAKKATVQDIKNFFAWANRM